MLPLRPMISLSKFYRKAFEHAITCWEIAIAIAVMLLLSQCKSDDDPAVDNDYDDKPTFTINGTALQDPCGNTVVIKGMNKMAVFDEGDPNGDRYFPEIAKTGSNAVRIVWQRTYSNGSNANPAQLDKLIANCINQKMIAVVEMHDATCNLAGLNDVVNYWKSAPILAIIKKYENALLVNIANEAGDYAVTASQFTSAYKSAISELRNVGIKAPLIIDAPDCGKNLELVVPIASQLIQHDPLHNIMVSTHPYWSIKAGATPAFIAAQLNAAVSASVPLLLGEVAGYGGWPGQGVDAAKSCSAEGQVDYKSILVEAEKHKIGWMLWEWGPGNGFYDRDPVVLCPAMDITTDGTYATIEAIKPGDPNAWAKDAVITGSYSMKNTAQKTAYMMNGFVCP